MTLRLAGSTSGYTEIDAPAVAGSNTLVLPSGNGSAGNILGTDGAGNLSWVNGRMVLETAKTATGTSVDFTGIPSWVKRVTVMFDQVSLSGTSNYLIQLGDSGGIENTGYTSGVIQATNQGTATDGFIASVGLTAASVTSGAARIQLLTGNTWAFDGGFVAPAVPRVCNASGSKTLSGTLDRIRITTVNGTDTFDAGSINILYEG
jgi:hypothetical protein